MGGSKIITGAHVLVYINGERLGTIFDFEYRALTPGRKIGGIDVPGLVEIAPGTEGAEGTFAVYRLIGDGGMEGAGVVPVSIQMPRGKYFSMQLVERTSDTTIFMARYCRVDTQNWKFATKRMVEGRISWTGLQHSNEVRPANL